jgi:hypothetical protein
VGKGDICVVDSGCGDENCAINGPPKLGGGGKYSGTGRTITLLLLSEENAFIGSV